MFGDFGKTLTYQFSLTTMQSLFPEGNNGQPAQAPLVQFRAGKCTMSSVQPNGKYLVTPDPRSGRVSLSKGNDGLVHFKWTNAATNTVEDDRIVFPGEYTFKKVKTGRDDAEGRVYQLRYSTGQQRLMFWMQEKSADNDADMVKKLNDFLLNPNAVVVASAPAAAAAAPGGDPVISPEEWIRLIGLNPPAAGAAAGAAAPARSSSSSSAPLGPPLVPEGLGNLDLAQILRTLSQQNSATAAAAASSVPPPAPASAASAAAPAAAPAGNNGNPDGAATGADGANPNSNQQGGSDTGNSSSGGNGDDQDSGGGDGSMEQ